MPELKSINKVNVVDKITKRITDAILDGRYKAGMKLPNEYELIEELQVSRNSLREAIKILSAMGIVEIRVGDGTYICTEMPPSYFDPVVYSIIYDMDENSDLTEFRQTLDESILMCAIQKADEDDLAALHGNLEAMIKAQEVEDYDRMQKLDMEFHLLLIDACKNKFYSRIMKGIYGIFERNINLVVENDRAIDAKSSAPLIHAEILQCIEDRDVTRIHTTIWRSLHWAAVREHQQ